jgi:hypothetical protein
MNGVPVCKDDEEAWVRQQQHHDYSFNKLTVREHVQACHRRPLGSVSPLCHGQDFGQYFFDGHVITCAFDGTDKETARASGRFWSGVSAC